LTAYHITTSYNLNLGVQLERHELWKKQNSIDDCKKQFLTVWGPAIVIAPLLAIVLDYCGNYPILFLNTLQDSDALGFMQQHDQPAECSTHKLCACEVANGCQFKCNFKEKDSTGEVIEAAAFIFMCTGLTTLAVSLVQLFFSF
jgi:hypothetical protein